jgi:hypothetical protein
MTDFVERRGAAGRLEYQTGRLGTQPGAIVANSWIVERCRIDDLHTAVMQCDYASRRQPCKHLAECLA